MPLLTSTEAAAMIRNEYSLFLSIGELDLAIQDY